MAHIISVYGLGFRLGVWGHVLNLKLSLQSASIWVAVKPLKVSYHNKEAVLFNFPLNRKFHFLSTNYPYNAAPFCKYGVPP